jgi:hypothetical protein
MVPLKNAWDVRTHTHTHTALHIAIHTDGSEKNGASKWTAAQREAYANDIDRPQLWAVTDNITESKGDRGPDEWKPPLQSFWCTYARAWVEVKSYYDLTVTSAEKSALGDMLDSC